MSLLRNCRPIYYTEIAKELELDLKYVHLILEILGNRDFTEYGTSPRGSWLTSKGEELLALAEKWKSDTNQPGKACCCPSVACPVHGLPPGSACGGW